jgi:two-component sensor histidine kinase
MTGLEFLARLRLDDPARAPSFAVVMLTGLASEQVAVEAMKAGAQDYIVKDRVTAEGLSMAVKRATEKVGLMRELRAERDRLAQSLEEKNVLLQEVHHRVKNNLQVIASLLRLQASQFAGISQPQFAEALRETQDRVASMALIHDQLYETGDLREVDLEEHASLLLSNLLLSYGVDGARVTGRVEMESLRLGVDRAIPAGLILNELISNALKHAFPAARPGSIVVRGRRAGGRITVEVADDGVGIPKDVDPRKSHSLGVKIVEILTRQLKGALEIESAPRTTFRVTFPE